MRQHIQIRLSIYSLMSLIWIFGCGDQNSQTTEISADDIVGEPIVEISEDTFSEESQIDDNKTFAVLPEANESETYKEILQEGIVVKGRPQPAVEANQTEEIMESNLPPLEEGSEYKPLAFRDMMNFEYLVEWEKDGKDFDFSSLH